MPRRRRGWRSRRRAGRSAHRDVRRVAKLVAHFDELEAERVPLDREGVVGVFHALDVEQRRAAARDVERLGARDLGRVEEREQRRHAVSLGHHVARRAARTAEHARAEVAYGRVDDPGRRNRADPLRVVDRKVVHEDVARRRSGRVVGSASRTCPDVDERAIRERLHARQVHCIAGWFRAFGLGIVRVRARGGSDGAPRERERERE